MVQVESYASDEPLLWFALSREGGEDEGERAAALELVAATSAFFGDWISPLAASVRVESCDPANYYFEDSDHPPACPHWFLRRRELDERLFISEAWVDSQERRVDVIGAAELLALVEEALAQPPPVEHLEVALAEVLVRATEVALPDGIELSLRYAGGAIKPILVRNGERWLAQGPDYGPVGRPAGLRASNDHGVTRMVVELYWDFWREHPEGRAQVRAAIERVLGRGRDWQIAEGNLP